MKTVLVLGAGVIGVTTAYYLNKLGLRVTVVDELHNSAEFTSFANAGQLSYSYAFPWAYPGIAVKAAKWAMIKSSPLRIKPDFKQLGYQISWLTEMLKNSAQSSYAQNKKAMLAISGLSKKVLNTQLTEKIISADQFNWQNKGTLQLFRTSSQMKAGEKDLALLHASGVNAEFIKNIDYILEKEPDLEWAARNKSLAGAIFLPDDETGDCNLYTKELTRVSEKEGVNFLFNTSVLKAKKESSSSTLVNMKTIKGDNSVIATFDQEFDAIVVCAGAKTPQVLESLGIASSRYMIYPVKGYSLTFDSELGPSSTVMDEKNKIAITRLGTRVRMGGVAELAGFNNDLDNYRHNQFIQVFEDLFGPSLAARDGSFWTGLRPATPSSVPYVEKVQENVFVNAGHGTLGWTMACGSAAIMSDLIEKEIS